MNETLDDNYAVNLDQRHMCEFKTRSWRGVLDTTLYDKSLSVTCDGSVVTTGFLHQ